MLRKLYYFLPPVARFWVRRLVYLPLDIFESLSGKRNPMVPPRGLIFTGSGDFEKQGQKMIRHLKDSTDLLPSHKILDIGSGIGRMAVALTGFLNSEGSYEGFDVVKKGVKWCQKNISSRYPNFQFQYIDLDNDLYKSSGASAEQFTFPYQEDQFDRILVISVFTHMLPKEVHQYLKEIYRVLQPGGQCLATFFILNNDSEALMEKNKHFHFPHDHGHYSLMSDRVKSANVAFEEDYLFSIVKEANLEIKHFFPGHWCGRNPKDCKDFQDILIFIKGS